MPSKTFAIKLTLGFVVIATASAVGAFYLFSSKPRILEKSLPLSGSLDFNNLSSGPCIKDLFGELDLKQVEEKSNNWKNTTFDFDNNNQNKANGCVILSSNTKKIQDKEDIKARWEGALTRGNYGFAFMLSIWNENKKLKTGEIYVLLEKKDNKWEIKRGIKSANSETNITNTNKDKYLITDSSKSSLDLILNVDVNKLCSDVECLNQEYTYKTSRYNWQEADNGTSAFGDWNKSENTVSSILKRTENKLTNLANLYLNQNGNTHKGNWTKIN